MTTLNRKNNNFEGNATRASAGAVLLLVGLLALVTGCEQKNAYAPPPPPEVAVAKPLQQAVTDYLEVTGNTQAFDAVDLRARIEGVLRSIHFEDGAVVNKGDLLFVIEPEPYAAKLKLAEAAVARQQATLTRAEQQYARQQRLFKQNAAAEADVEQWRAERDAAKAALDEARSNVEMAKINFGYTHVTAPFDGRMGRHLVDPGNIVGAGEPTKLATIERLDPIHAYFNVNEREVLRIRGMQRQRGSPDYRAEPVPVFLGLQTEEGYPHEGRVDFIATGIDPSTGTLQARSVHPNPDKTLLLGVFVRLRIPVEKRDNAFLVANRSLGVDQGGRYLLVVNNDNVVEQRIVKVGARVDQLRVIEDGLKADDWIVVEGIQRARPGAKVTPVRMQEMAAARPSTKGGGSAPPASGAP